MSQLTPYIQVNNLLQSLILKLHTTLNKNLLGVYVYGSLVWGEFNEQISDIDILTVKVRLKNMSTQSFRILIMGAAGAGSSTLGKALAQKHQWPHFDSDKYYWLPSDPPFTLKRPPEERVKLLSKDLNIHQNWVVSGVLCNWGNFIIPLLTHVIFLYADWPTRLKRIKQRETKQFGKRILKGGDMYEHHEAFVEWASQYDSNNPVSRTKNKHLEWLTSLPSQIQIIQLDANIEVSALLNFCDKRI